MNPRKVKAASRSADASSRKVSIDLGAIRESKPRDFAIRFAFGATISVIAGLVSLAYGPRVGGLFLAFPAIMPAALTLIEKKKGEGPADADAQGGILGSIGMIIFAGTVFAGAQIAGAPVALGLALVSWAVVSSGLYLLLRRAWPRVWG
ncbi:MAG: hypothetical protein QOK05_1481 [Chloroflexota bacterium]|jgi:uncharacterized membrane protein (GlpM family)|nr:hypothetical protein [Chloroflexota bacterium]